MRRSRLFLPLCAGLILLHAIPARPASAAAPAERFRFPEKRHGKGELKYINKIPVLKVEGTPEEIGEQIGVLALKPAARALDYPHGLLDAFAIPPILWGQAVRQGKAMVENFPADYRKEMETMAKAAGAPWDKVVVGNTLFDIKKMFFCSALLIDADRSATHGPLLGRNLDYPSLGYIDQYSLVTVYRPKGKHAFVSVGFPGLIGSLSGMNDAGLAVGVLESFAVRKGEGRFDPKGLPYALCFRTLLEECTTIAEAKKRLESLPRTTLTSLVIADRKGIGVLEITPKSVVLRRADKGVCSCTNHFCTELKSATKLDVARTYERFETLEDTRKLERPVRVEDIRKKLDEVNLGDLTLQTMVFEPATLKLHLGIGKPPASSRPLRTLELAPLLKPEDRVGHKMRD
ncbi:MAG TPA: C45 family peptidase [Gemmataceae bacterium]|nr:C45 family peptidase [Gemmataceae bacterium]